MAVSAAQFQKEGYQEAVLPELPYAKDALEPYLSAETLEYHYGKHHQTYVDTLNKLIEGTPYEKQSIEDMIREADGKVFNNAAQVWNHTFYWFGLAPDAGGQPGDELRAALSESFGDFDTFKDAFETKCKNVFGSGWVWLVRDEDGQLKIEIGKDAGNPLRDNKTPLLNCDMWEHAFYIDYRNAKQKYLDAFWNIVNWDTVARRLAGESSV